jgi:toxin ParE1/3/4
LKYPVEKSPEAERDLAEIWHFIALDSIGAADGVIETIDEKMVLLSEWPFAGRERDEYLPGLRSIGAGKYLLFYQVRGETVQVIRVVHGSRDLPTVFGKKA